jgi:hypothetical protein
MKTSRILITFCGLLCILVFSGCSDTSSHDPTQKTIDTTVVNLKANAYDEYIGRRSKPYTHMLTAGIKPGTEGWLGNPLPIGRCNICNKEHTRTECISAFKKDFYKAINSRDPDFKKHILSMKGKRLGCFCKPQDCHGDVIKRYIESQ